MEITWKPTTKQFLAYEYLNDNVTKEIFYGGAAGGGKTYLGCVWVIISALRYEGTRYLVGRAILKNLKASTLLTFFDVCNQWGLKKDVHYTYNSVESTIKFYNGSEVYLKDLFQYPSDPEFDSLGSTEYTYAFIDEASQINEKAYNIVKSRLRFKHKELNLTPKILTCSNPSKNFLYNKFYKPFKTDTLSDDIKFIPALISDNPYLPEGYKDTLQSLDKVSRERLLYGNFEYDDDPTKLISYDDILQMFLTRDLPKSKKFMSVDVARLGRDKTVIMLWNGLHVYKIVYIKKNKIDELCEIIRDLARENRISMDNVVVDEDGVGGGVVDTLQLENGFVNNSSAYENDETEQKYNYANLKTQCYFKLAELISAKRISIYEYVDLDVKEMIIQELEQVKLKNLDKDNKLRIVDKEHIKKMIGRSPDYSDALMMRMLFEVKPKDNLLFFEG